MIHKSVNLPIQILWSMRVSGKNPLMVPPLRMVLSNSRWI